MPYPVLCRLRLPGRLTRQCDDRPTANSLMLRMPDQNLVQTLREEDDPDDIP